jgi:hypothetical protein
MTGSMPALDAWFLNVKGPKQLSRPEVAPTVSLNPLIPPYLAQCGNAQGQNQDHRGG